MFHFRIHPLVIEDRILYPHTSRPLHICALGNDVLYVSENVFFFVFHRNTFSFTVLCIFFFKVTHG